MEKEELLKVKHRARRRGKRAQVGLAKYLGGENIGTLGGVDVRVGSFYIESKEKADIPNWFSAAWDQAKIHAKNKIPAIYFHKFKESIPNDWIILNAYFFKRLLDAGLDEIADAVLRQMKKEEKICQDQEQGVLDLQYQAEPILSTLQIIEEDTQKDISI